MERRKKILLIMIVILIVIFSLILYIVVKNKTKTSNQNNDSSLTVVDSDLDTSNWRDYLDISGTITAENGNLVYEIVITPNQEDIILENMTATATLTIKATINDNGTEKTKVVELQFTDLKKSDDNKYVFSGTYTEENVTFKGTSLKEDYFQRHIRFTEITGNLYIK
jgi:uncharacterized protein YpmB